MLRMGERRRRTGPASLQSVRAGSKSGKDIRVSFAAFVILQGVFFYFFLFLSNVASDDAGEPASAGGSGHPTRCDAKSPTTIYAYVRGRG